MWITCTDKCKNLVLVHGLGLRKFILKDCHHATFGSSLVVVDANIFFIRVVSIYLVVFF